MNFLSESKQKNPQHLGPSLFENCDENFPKHFEIAKIDDVSTLAKRFYQVKK